MQANRARRGVSRVDVLAAVASVAGLCCVVLPGLAAIGARSGVTTSMSNLIDLAIANWIYAADYEDRQFTLVADDFSQYGSGYSDAVLNFKAVNGYGHPAIVLGWGPGPTGGATSLWYYSPYASQILSPMAFSSANNSFGTFRLPNVFGFYQYVNGQFYDSTFYPPNDTVVYDYAADVLDGPYQFQLIEENSVAFSSYCRSAAAMWHPDVLSKNPETGEHYTDPFQLPWGYESPAITQVQYADLKTQLMEHHWNQNAPADPCNPFFGDNGTYGGCEPYYFNASLASEPVTLFYDGSVRLLPVLEAQLSDQQVLDQTGGEHGLWSRDTPLGEDGYFLEAAYTTDVDVSHHVLTIDGILGRDTLGPEVLEQHSARYRYSRSLSRPSKRELRHDTH